MAPYGHAKTFPRVAMLVTSIGHHDPALLLMPAGACPRSYGTNVARLAGLPERVVQRAAHMSRAKEQEEQTAATAAAGAGSGGTAAAAGGGAVAMDIDEANTGASAGGAVTGPSGAGAVLLTGGRGGLLLAEVAAALRGALAAAAGTDEERQALLVRARDLAASWQG